MVTASSAGVCTPTGRAADRWLAAPPDSLSDSTDAEQSNTLIREGAGETGGTLCDHAVMSCVCDVLCL